MFANITKYLLLTTLFTATSGQTSPRHQVTSIPGWTGPPPTKHWSGFVETDKPTGTNLFYYLVESQSSPSTDPLFLWMNGGPGASSLAGVFGENGPLLLQDDLSLMQNPYAWNRQANVLAIEFGPGIGYSYCHNSTLADGPCSGVARQEGECSPCFASDTSVATQNAIVLETLLGDPTLFPELAGRPLYILGESYAGVYIPTLAIQILKRQNSTELINLSGLWVTDPCTDNDAQFGWLDLGVDFAYQKGLISGVTYDLLSGKKTQECIKGRTKVGDRLRNVNTMQCRRAWRLYDMATAGIGDAVHPAGIPNLPMYIDPLNAYGLAGGADLPAFLQSARKNFNAQQSPNTQYLVEIGNNGYDQYELEYAACNNKATPNAPSMVDVYRTIVDEVKQQKNGAAINLGEIIILNGDIDPVVDMHGTEKAVRKIGFPVIAGQDRRPWFYNSTGTSANVVTEKPTEWGPTLHTKNAGAQVGGFVIGFDAIGTNSGNAGNAPQPQLQFRFVTVRNSGHMTPAYGPQKTLRVVYHALVGKQLLSPVLPATMFNVSDNEFYDKPGLFAQWVNSAMSNI